MHLQTRENGIRKSYPIRSTISGRECRKKRQGPIKEFRIMPNNIFRQTVADVLQLWAASFQLTFREVLLFLVLEDASNVFFRCAQVEPISGLYSVDGTMAMGTCSMARVRLPFVSPLKNPMSRLRTSSHFPSSYRKDSLRFGRKLDENARSKPFVNTAHATIHPEFEMFAGSTPTKISSLWQFINLDTL